MPIAWGRIARGPVRDHSRRDHAKPLVLRLGGQMVRETVPAGDLAREPALAWVEAALMASSEPLPARRLATAAQVADAAEVRRLVARLQELYDRDGTAFQVQELAGGYQLLTRPQYHSWLVRLRRGSAEPQLSAALRETLAIIAYRQPIMRADIEGVRGVHVGEALRLLMEKGLVRIVGRDVSLGRPHLFGTTKRFLQMFGLRDLRDLPVIEQLRPPAVVEEPGQDAS